MNTQLQLPSEVAGALSWYRKPVWIWAGRLAALTLVVFSILFLRRPDSLMNPQFWAEDGANFFAEQVRLGFFKALVYPHNGYLHVVPRLIAGAASLLPVRWAPFTYDFCALVVSALCLTAFALPCCRNLIASDWLRAATCLVASAGVYCNEELLGNVTNLQCYLAIAALILIFCERSETRTRRLDIALAALGLLIALSTPLLYIFVPWLIWYAVRWRGSGKLLPGAILAGLALQFHFMLRDPNLSHMHVRVNSVFFGIVGLLSRFNTIFLGTVAGLYSRPVLTDFLGHGELTRGSDETFVVELIILLILTSIWFTRLCLTLERSRRRVVIGTLYFWAVAVAFPLIGRNIAGMFVTIWSIRNTPAERYFFFSSCLIVFLVAFTLEAWWKRGPRWVKPAALAALFSFAIVNNFAVPAYRDYSWPSYAPRIEQWIADRKQGKPVQPLTLPINPPGWTMILSEK